MDLYHEVENFNRTAVTDDIVKLVDPTDFDILTAMSDGKRQTAPNLATILDKRRQYMNDRLSSLASQDLISKVGPSPRSGMYEINEYGKRALQYRDLYSHNKGPQFRKLVHGQLDPDDLRDDD